MTRESSVLSCSELQTGPRTTSAPASRTALAFSSATPKATNGTNLSLRVCRTQRKLSAMRFRNAALPEVRRLSGEKITRSIHPHKLSFAISSSFAVRLHSTITRSKQRSWTSASTRLMAAWSELPRRTCNLFIHRVCNSRSFAKHAGAKTPNRRKLQCKCRR